MYSRQKILHMLEIVMLLKINDTELFFVLFAIFFSSQIVAEEITTKEAQIRTKLAPLGSNVVEDSLPGIIINKPYRYIVGNPGKYIYKVIKTDDESVNTNYELRRELDSDIGQLKSWSVKIDNDFIEEWATDNKGNVHLVAETDIDAGYRVELTPHLLLPAGAKQGQRWKNKSNLKVYETSDPGTIAYQGELLSDKTYEGRFKIITPAGNFDTILISDDYEINIGAVNIKDKRYTFYAPNVGKVAEIDGFHVSAFLFFHKRKNESKILMVLPQPM